MGRWPGSRGRGGREANLANAAGDAPEASGGAFLPGLDELPGDDLAEWEAEAPEIVAAIAATEPLEPSNADPEPPAAAADTANVIDVGAADVVPDAGEVVAEAGTNPLQEPAPSPEVAPVVVGNMCGPTPLGYFTDRRVQRSIGRITGPFSDGSVGLRCSLHPECSLAMAEWKLPGLQELRSWFENAEVPLATATKGERRAMAKAHIAQLKVLREAAVWPGRTKQSLIDQAREIDPPEQ